MLVLAIDGLCVCGRGVLLKLASDVHFFVKRTALTATVQRRSNETRTSHENSDFIHELRRERTAFHNIVANHMSNSIKSRIQLNNSLPEALKRQRLSSSKPSAADAAAVQDIGHCKTTRLRLVQVVRILSAFVWLLPSC